MPTLVVAEDDVAGRPSGGGEGQAGGDVGERVVLVGFDEDELRRGAACGATTARHIRFSFATDGFEHLARPRGEVSRSQG
ncbi:MAG: hypothetical protein ACR2MN_01465 [Acidimicrobiales bacterium]